MTDQNNKQLSPCIVSWAFYALDIKTIQPINDDKTCSNEYWIKVIDCILSQPKYASYITNRQAAIERYPLVEG